jgi:hypothetical protein
MAAAAVQDRLLRLDEPAAATLTSWRDDPVRSRITIRQILNLTSGLATRRARGDLMTYEETLDLPAVAEPGTSFVYGGDPFQLFGLILRRKLKERETPVDYLRRRVLDPAGVEVGEWRNGPDALPRLGSGARLTARNWARFGELVRNGCVVGGRRLVDPAALAACFEGSRANPAYGLGWWLNRPMPAEQRRAIPQLVLATDVRPEEPAFPADLVLAAGAGQQRPVRQQDRRAGGGASGGRHRSRHAWPSQRPPLWRHRLLASASRPFRRLTAKGPPSHLGTSGLRRPFSARSIGEAKWRKTTKRMRRRSARRQPSGPSGAARPTWLRMRIPPLIRSAPARAAIGTIATAGARPPGRA